MVRSLLLGYAALLARDEDETKLPSHMSSVNLKAIAAEAGRCRHFCPSKWAKVGGMEQMDGSVLFAPKESY